MYTQISNRDTRESRDWEFRLRQEMILRNFSKKTIAVYLHYNRELLRFASYKAPLEINRQDIRDYLEFLIRGGKKASTINLVINAIKFYYENILHRSFFDQEIGIKRPKQEKYLPTVLSKNEIVEMIGASENIKHKLVIQILYSTGMRVGELRNLRISHIDFERKVVMVKSGKGNKDRMTVVSRTTLENINKYLIEYKPLKYLFESYQAGLKMSVRTLQKVVENAAKAARIAKPVSAHTLRHSFATHQLENNVNLRYIQSMLGHARLETTQIYTKVALNKLEEIEDLL